MWVFTIFFFFYLQERTAAETWNSWHMRIRKHTLFYTLQARFENSAIRTRTIWMNKKNNFTEPSLHGFRSSEKRFFFFKTLISRDFSVETICTPCLRTTDMDSVRTFGIVGVTCRPLIFFFPRQTTRYRRSRRLRCINVPSRVAFGFGNPRGLDFSKCFQMRVRVRVCRLHTRRVRE